MKAYVDDIIVTDASGEKAVLYPRTKQEAVFGLMERLGKLEAPHITETEATTMENSYAGRLEIVNIGGGESEQDKTTGAQLFDADNVVSAAEASFSVVGDKITVTGKNAYSGVNRIIQNIEELIGKTLTLLYKGYVKSIVESAVSIQAKLIYADSTSAYKTITGATGGSISFDVPENIKNIAVQLFVNNSGSALNADNVVTFEGVMLSIGTEALPWEPYTGGLPAPNPDYPQEIKKTVVSEILTHGKNFLKNNLTSRTDNGITLTKNDDGIITVNGTATATVEISLNSTFMPDKDSEYILSGCPSGGSADTYSLRYYEWSGGWKQLFRNNDYGNGVILRHTDEAVNFATRIVIVNGTTVSNLVFKPMIRKIDVENDTYEPYTESTIALSQPIELYGIGDVQDVIEDGKVKRRFKKIVFDGDENWRTSSVLVGRYVINLTNIKNFTHAICTQFIEGESGSTSVNEFWLNSPHQQIAFNTPFATLDEWKAHLQANPMTVVYQLVEKAVEELPLADQIALNSISTYDGITYVDVVSDIPPTFKGKYGTSEVGGMVLEGKLAGLNGELYGISNADRIAALEATVVNNI